MKLPHPRRGSFFTKHFNNPNKAAYWLLALLIATLYTILCCYTPFYLDDWVFMSFWKEFSNNDNSFSFTTWKDFYLLIRDCDNGRIANALSPISTMFSPLKELFPFLTGLFVVLTAITVQKQMCRKLSPLYLALTWAFMIVVLPWRDTLFVRDYALNYIWAGFFNIMFLCLLQRGEKEGWKWPVFMVTIISAILAGGWHESFAFASNCGLALFVLSKKFRVSTRFYIIFAIFFIATFAFYLSPGMILRTETHVDGHIHLPGWKVKVTYIFLSALILISICTKTGRSIIRHSIKSNAVVVCWGIMISGLAIAMMSTSTFRSYYWPNLAAIALIINLIYAWSRTIRNYTAIKWGATIVLSVLCISQVLISIIWTARYTDDWKNIMALIEKSETGTVFYDSPNPYYAPKVTLGIPYARAWRSPSNMLLLYLYLDKPMLGVVPTKLKDATLVKAHPLKSPQGIYLYEGLLISAFEGSDVNHDRIVPFYREITVTYPDGHILDGRLIAIPFINESGDTLLYHTLS